MKKRKKLDQQYSEPGLDPPLPEAEKARNSTIIQRAVTFLYALYKLFIFWIGTNPSRES